MNNVLEVENLHVRYGSFEAVRGVSFSAKKGEIFGIVGESGSGKSTIAKTLLGLEKASSGEIRRGPFQMQMIFQDAVGSLNPRKSVKSTLLEACKHAKANAKRAKNGPCDIAGLLSKVGLSEAVLDQYPREMSGGQCQRVSIARALAAGGEILVADEPVSALDVSVQARVLNLLRDLRRESGITIILIAHDLAVVKNVCDRVAVMEKGVFVEEGLSSEVFENPRHPYTKKLLDAVPDVKRALADKRASIARSANQRQDEPA